MTLNQIPELSVDKSANGVPGTDKRRVKTGHRQHWNVFALLPVRPGGVFIGLIEVVRSLAGAVEPSSQARAKLKLCTVRLTAS
jgi:hypothetical protein